MVQQSTILAEEAHQDRLVDGETDHVHPSQLESEEALPELVPKWRLKQIAELEAERNDTSELSRREKKRVRKRLETKRTKQKAIEQAINLGLPEFDELLGASNADPGPDADYGGAEELEDLEEGEAANF